MVTPLDWLEKREGREGRLMARAQMATIGVQGLLVAKAAPYLLGMRVVRRGTWEFQVDGVLTAIPWMTLAAILPTVWWLAEVSKRVPRRVRGAHQAVVVVDPHRADVPAQTGVLADGPDPAL